ncbi:MAG TPA: BMP family ABC transporter substrate-binding protein [bacterium]|nr:BMP family ABC transporter substrate-binding protein [bacterium]
MRVVGRRLGLLLIGIVALAVIAGPSPGAERLKVGFVYVGPVGDAGWTYAHDQGRKFLEAHDPSIVTTAVENVAEGADSERVFTDLARKGYKLIIGTSFGYMDPMLKVAGQFPNVDFVHISGFKRAKNLMTAFGRIEQPRYLSGLVAGSLTKTNIIGYVAAHPIPEVVRGINAFTLGVQAVNPAATVRVVWSNTWYDPAQEKEAAESLLNARADVIAQHQDSPAPVQAAAAAGKYAVGYNSDMSRFGPKAFLTAPVWNWGPMYLYIAKQVEAGAFRGEDLWWGIERGVVDIAPLGPMVPARVKSMVMARRRAIISGAFKWFAGPILDQRGTVRVPKGSALSDADQLSMNWFVKGVVGTVPAK